MLSSLDALCDCENFLFLSLKTYWISSSCMGKLGTEFCLLAEWVCFNVLVLAVSLRLASTWNDLAYQVKKSISSIIERHFDGMREYFGLLEVSCCCGGESISSSSEKHFFHCTIITHVRMLSFYFTNFLFSQQPTPRNGTIFVHFGENTIAALGTQLILFK